jgi:hypothetical protein
MTLCTQECRLLLPVGQADEAANLWCSRRVFQTLRVGRPGKADGFAVGWPDLEVILFCLSLPLVSSHLRVSIDASHDLLA